ncbi:MAG: DM13 domain-containing protein [Acidimicrobiaceae bacterium]|nr:DM13 domain-containing protein [Acidimicrobiaceae bacterium]
MSLLNSSWVKRYGRWLLLGAGTAIGVWLVFGVFAFQTLFIDNEVDEPPPFFVAGPAPSNIEGDETTQEQADAMNKVMEELDMPMDMVVNEEMPSEMSSASTTSEDSNGEDDTGEDTAIDQDSRTDDDGTDGNEGGATDTDGDNTNTTEGNGSSEGSETPEVKEPQIIVEAEGTFIPRSHPTQGKVQVWSNGQGQRILRLENLQTDNGPDLNVYLSTASVDAPAGEFDDDFFDLGDLKGNIGSQNYDIPADVDLNRYSTVAIWCVRFGVVFGVAELSST